MPRLYLHDHFKWPWFKGCCWGVFFIQPNRLVGVSSFLKKQKQQKTEPCILPNYLAWLSIQFYTYAILTPLYTTYFSWVSIVQTFQNVYKAIFTPHVYTQCMYTGICSKTAENWGASVWFQKSQTSSMFLFLFRKDLWKQSEIFLRSMFFVSRDMKRFKERKNKNSWK